MSSSSESKAQIVVSNGDDNNIHHIPADAVAAAALSSSSESKAQIVVSGGDNDYDSHDVPAVVAAALSSSSDSKAQIHSSSVTRMP